MVLYRGNVSYLDKLSAEFTASAVFGAIKYKFVYNDSKESGWYVFGSKLKEKEQKEKEAELPDSSEDKKVEHADDKAKKAIDIFTDEKTGIAFSAIKGNLLKLLKHVFPKEIYGKAIFGFEDPYYTGKLLELFALLYAGAGDKLYVEPVWDRKVFEADLTLSGRICTLYILILVLRIFLNKEFTEFRRKYYVK